MSTLANPRNGAEMASDNFDHADEFASTRSVERANGRARTLALKAERSVVLLDVLMWKLYMEVDGADEESVGEV